MKASKTMIVLIFLLVSVSTISSRSAGFRRFNVENWTGSPITITREMAPSETNDLYYWWGRSIINEHGEEMWLYVTGLWESRAPIEQLPTGSHVLLFEEYRESSLLMSNIDKLRLLYTSFIVTDEQGNVLKTLDSFTEDDFFFDNVPSVERPNVTGSMILRIR